MAEHMNATRTSRRWVWVCDHADVHSDGQTRLVLVGEDCPACGAAEGDDDA